VNATDVEKLTVYEVSQNTSVVVVEKYNPHPPFHPPDDAFPQTESNADGVAFIFSHKLSVIGFGEKYERIPQST
jgi:hypothetical protein